MAAHIISNGNLNHVAAALTASLFQKLIYADGTATPAAITKLFFEVQDELLKAQPGHRNRMQDAVGV